MKHLFLTLLLLAGVAQAWEYRRDASPLPLPENYQTPAAGKTDSRFDRKPQPPYIDTASGQLVVECCHPPVARGGVSHFYTTVYRLEANGRHLTKTQRMWQSHQPGKEAHNRTYTFTTDTPYSFDSGSHRIEFEADAQGRITKVTLHGKLFQKKLPPEGKVFYPGTKAPGLIHLVP